MPRAGVAAGGVQPTQASDDCPLAVHASRRSGQAVLACGVLTVARAAPSCPLLLLLLLLLWPPAGLKLFGVGLFASLLGVGITNSLMAIRQFLDPTFVPLNPAQVCTGRPALGASKCGCGH